MTAGTFGRRGRVRPEIITGLGWLLGAAVLVAAAIQLGHAAYLITEDPDLTGVVPVSDLGRDVIGARAAARGMIPFGQLQTLDESVPADAGTWWVNHAPFAIGIAAGFDAVTDAPDRLGRLLTVVALLVVAFVVGKAAVAERSPWWVLVALAVIGGLPVWADLDWVQVGAVTGLGYLAVLELVRRGRPRAGLALLGVLVAWKPWLAPLVVAVPGHRSLWRDVGWAATGGALATAVVVPFTGGVEGITTWVTVAGSRNLEQYRQIVGNLSLTRSLPLLLAYLIFVAGIGLVAAARSKVASEVRPVVAAVVIMSLSLLVWPHYWTVLVVSLVPAMRAYPRWRRVGRVVVFAFALSYLVVLAGGVNVTLAVNLAASLGVIGGGVGVLGELDPSSSRG